MTEDQLARQREYRRNNGNSVTKRYERTKRGKLMRIYRNMQSRVTGVQWKKRHLYEGKALLGREEFYQWAVASPDFHRLYREWVASGYDRKLAPSVDRRDSELGYEIGNIRWLTHSENSRLGGMSKKRKKSALPAMLDSEGGLRNAG